MLFALENVSFAYSNGSAVLDKADLSIPAGEFVLVRGPSGAGKSTLLRLLCRLEEPVQGRILFEGQPLAGFSPPELRRRVAYVQQTPVTVGGSVRDNLLLSFAFHSAQGALPPDDDLLRARLDSVLLQSVDLDRPAADLSVGQAQRVCLLRTLLMEPKVLLMDEPTSALDLESAKTVLALARQAHDQGVSVLIISHNEQPPDGVTRTLSVNNGRTEWT